MSTEQNLEYSVYKRIVPWIVAFALFMETLDVTILNSAIPVIARNLNQYPLNLKVALTSYLVSLGILIPISGWLSDKYGTKKVLIFGVAVFGLGSFLCGISLSLKQLVISRIIQGAGGALMMPVCRLILIKSYPPSQLISVTNYSTIPSLLGPALGPTIGGIIVTWLSWRWIFFVNIPFCFILLYLVFCYADNSKESNVRKFDIIGFILFGSALSITIFTIEAFTESFLDLLHGMFLVSIAFVLMVLYFYFEKKVAEPFIGKKLFESRTFTITITGSFFSRLGIGGIPFLIPILLQINNGFSPITSGFCIISYAAAMVVAKFFVKEILRKIGFRSSLILNTALLGVSIIGLILLIDNTNYFIISSLVFLHGFFTSIQYSCLNILTYSDLKEELVSKGTSIGSAIQQLSMSFGVAFTVVLLKITKRNNPLIGHTSYDLTIFILAICLLLTSLIFTALNSNAGVKASNHKFIEN
ncbi:MFS transporter [Wolbachia endosymbiont of Ctenocephalides felis wCfeJ]|uniref:MFS transporter n=1 Tax=Wolbachia endosymbiont of Ctenocephalides felis wCfeJ TaxID=2732594 RepID=UPI001444B6F2|nr:MFS transporter [Wolbachia endosymbiont of Ctenocephalides felis wCfeJ]WCR58559.1 MAG: putative transport protein HsrA [Wolbachia endosymbiont of Ctenocephalides felis wCfeJ]